VFAQQRNNDDYEFNELLFFVSLRLEKLPSKVARIIKPTKRSTVAANQKFPLEQ
jgi:hypothetical protein